MPRHSVQSPPQRDNPNNRSERWFDVLKLILGFVLTGFLRTIITERYKKLDAEESRAIESRKEAREVLYESLINATRVNIQRFKCGIRIPIGLGTIKRHLHGNPISKLFATGTFTGTLIVAFCFIISLQTSNIATWK